MGMKICEKCNKINLEKATVCKYCGEPLDTEIPKGFKIVSNLDDDLQSVSYENKFAKSTSHPKPTPKFDPAPTPKSTQTPNPTPAPIPKPVPAMTSQHMKNDDNVNSKITVCPSFSGKSVKYAAKINAYDGFDKIKCPKCGADNISLVSNTQKRGFSGNGACCGTMILGPIGILCGSIGANKTSTTEYWVCGSCGNHFQTNSGNAEKEKIKNQGMLLCNTPDDVIENVDLLLTKSTEELTSVKEYYKAAFKDEYLGNKNLKIYAISSFAAVLVLLILAILLYFVFDAEATVSMIIGAAAIIGCVAAVILKPKMEEKFASKSFLQAKSDVKDAADINNRLKNIKTAKDNLSKLRII